MSVWPHSNEEGTACFHDLARVGEQGRGHALPQAWFMLTSDAGNVLEHIQALEQG